MKWRRRGARGTVPWLCTSTDQREGEKDRNGRGGICLVPGGGKIKRKGGRGGTWVVGKKKERKNKNKEMGYVGGGGKKGKENNNNKI